MVQRIVRTRAREKPRRGTKFITGGYVMGYQGLREEEKKWGCRDSVCYAAARRPMVAVNFRPNFSICVGKQIGDAVLLTLGVHGR